LIQACTLLCYSNKVLQITSGMDDMKEVKWTLTLCNLFVWIVVFLVLSKGIKSLGKVGLVLLCVLSYIFCSCPISKSILLYTVCLY